MSNYALAAKRLHMFKGLKYENMKGRLDIFNKYCHELKYTVFLENCEIDQRLFYYTKRKYFIIQTPFPLLLLVLVK